MPVSFDGHDKTAPKDNKIWFFFNSSSTNYQWDIITEFILTLTNSQKEKPKSERKGKPEKTKKKAKKESDEESEEEQDESEEEDADISEGSDSD